MVTLLNEGWLKISNERGSYPRQSLILLLYKAMSSTTFLNKVHTFCGPWEYNHGMHKPSPWKLNFRQSSQHPMVIFSRPTIKANSHEAKSLWPLHFKHSHWWKRWSRSKFAWHYSRGTHIVCECKMDVKVYMDSYMTWNATSPCFMFHGHLDNFQTPPLWR